MFFFSPIWFVFAIPPLLLMLYAQHRIHSAYGRYVRVPNGLGLPGGTLAQRLLDLNGLRHVAIEVSEGALSDHYDPARRTLRLSPEIYSTASVASLGIVAHEVGHAVQDARSFAPMQFRSSLVPVVNFGSSLAPWLFIIGLLLHLSGLVWRAVIFFSGSVLFHLVTLPVELDASRRAKAMLRANGLVTPAERSATNEVLNAAALTYLAALFQATGQLLYFVFAAMGMAPRRDD